MRALLQQIRKIVFELAPDAEETKSYGMPAFKYNGKYLVAFAVFKDHLSLFPGGHAIEAVQDKLVDYKTSKGTVQFTIDKPLPDSVIREIITVRLKDI